MQDYCSILLPFEVQTEMEMQVTPATRRLSWTPTPPCRNNNAEMHTHAIRLSRRSDCSTTESKTRRADTPSTKTLSQLMRYAQSTNSRNKVNRKTKTCLQSSYIYHAVTNPQNHQSTNHPADPTLQPPDDLWDIQNTSIHLIPKSHTKPLSFPPFHPIHAIHPFQPILSP